jgi:hypothetical protein
MLAIAARLLGCLLIAGVASACARKPDEAPPVATPTVTLDRTDVAIGSPVDVTYKFAVAPDAPAFAEDHWVFVHFLDTDGELMWTDDHQPPTPTTAWKPGSSVEYTRTTFVPKFPYTGEMRVEIGVFSRQTSERLPLDGQNAGMRSYRVAAFTVRPQSDNLFVVFRDGWYDTEVGDEGGVEWQWSRRAGTLTFRNPKRDVVLFLQVDQPALLKEPRQVEVRSGAMPVDTFSLQPGVRELRRINLSPQQLGEGETVELTVAVDKTFVPASVPELKSLDPRELGVRVFRAYVQPK